VVIVIMTRIRGRVRGGVRGRGRRIYMRREKREEGQLRWNSAAKSIEGWSVRRTA
jgi:hypothetical protein